MTAWIATKPLTNPKAPLTPFAMPEYTSAATAEADALETKADLASAESQANVQRADRYTLCVVLFAMALFFAGISTRLRTGGTRYVALGIGWASFLAAIVWMVTFPVSVGL